MHSRTRPPPCSDTRKHSTYCRRLHCKSHCQLCRSRRRRWPMPSRPSHARASRPRRSTRLAKGHCTRWRSNDRPMPSWTRRWPSHTTRRPTSCSRCPSPPGWPLSHPLPPRHCSDTRWQLCNCRWPGCTPYPSRTQWRPPRSPQLCFCNRIRWRHPRP